MRILITRPAEDAERTIAGLQARGHDIVHAPLLAIEPLPFQIRDQPYAALVLTSANALRALAGHRALMRLRALRAFCVGAQTAEAARAAGFRDVFAGPGTGAELAPILAEQFRGVSAPLLYLAAKDRAVDIAAALAPHGVRVETMVAYRAVARPQLPDDVLAALQADAVEVALHYSRRSADAFVAAATAAGAIEAARRVQHVCISDAAAAPLRDLGCAHVLVAEKPHEGSMLDLIGAPRVAAVSPPR